MYTIFFYPKDTCKWNSWVPAFHVAPSLCQSKESTAGNSILFILKISLAASNSAVLHRSPKVWRWWQPFDGTLGFLHAHKALWIECTWGNHLNLLSWKTCFYLASFGVLKWVGQVGPISIIGQLDPLCQSKADQQKRCGFVRLLRPKRAARDVENVLDEVIGRAVGWTWWVGMGSKWPPKGSVWGTLV